jgi:hypothetical protein
MLTVGAAALLMIAGCSLVRSSPANASNVVGTTIFPSGQRPLMPAVSGRTLTGQELRLAAEHGHVMYWLRGSWCSGLPAGSTCLSLPRGSSSLGVQFVGVDVEDNSASAKAKHAVVRASLPKPEDPGDLIAAEFNRLMPINAFPARS